MEKTDFYELCRRRISTKRNNIKEKENKNEKAAAEAENTKTKAKAQAEANKELSASITDELIKMKEAEAHYKNGWVTVQGADAVIADK